MEDETMEGGVWLMRWNFEKHGYNLQSIGVISPKLSQAFLLQSSHADAEMHPIKLKQSAFINSCLQSEAGKKIRVLLPIYRSSHWVSVV